MKISRSGSKKAAGKPARGFDRETGRNPAGFDLGGSLKRAVSPLEAIVWRRLLLAAGASILSVASIRLTADGGAFWLGAALFFSSAGWLTAISLLLLDARAKLLWRIWLFVGLALLLSLHAVAGIYFAGLAFSAVFLIFRRYRPFRHLSSRRKAALFLMALLMFIGMRFGSYPDRSSAVSVSLPADPPASSEALEVQPSSSLVFQLFHYAYGSVALFWLFSLFHLFFNIRLHFMRLKPKLAVISIMLAGVPLALVIAMGLVTLYTTLGESRALRATHLLRDWAESASREPGFMDGLSDQVLSIRVEAEGGEPDPEAPVWLAALAARTRSRGWDFAEWNPAETGHYLWVNNELWLVAVRDRGPGGLEIRAARLDRQILDRLAGILHCDVRLLFSNRLTFSGGQKNSFPEISIRESDASLDVAGRLSRRGGGGDRSIWKRTLMFGASHINVLAYEETIRDFSRRQILLLLEGRLDELVGELTSTDNPLSRAVLFLLAVLAALLMVLELFALFFGLRITTGFTSAVRALHLGTRKIARGELETRINIPNEDELGDLAAAFNEMAAAVEQGRREAVARERLESELKTARKIQERLLPDEIPDIPGFEITGTSLPSQEVGGDYFDFLDMGGDRLGIAIGDVSGKGIPAALLMANLQASLHAQAFRSDKVADVVSRMNDLLVKSTDSHMFATFFYGILDRSSSIFRSTNAGHNPPMLFRAGGKIERLAADGLILGFMAGQSYSSHSSRLGPGDVLVLFTDGITEAVRLHPESGERDMFGEERLIEIVQRHRSNGARVIHAEILSAVVDHAGGAPQSDDVTLVVIKRLDRSGVG